MKIKRTDPLLPGLTVDVRYKDVWKCGGGTQSVAIGAMIVMGILPKPDIAVIANTGREKKTTWDYADKVLAPALASVGVTLHRPSAAEYGYYREAIYQPGGKQSLLIPAFTKQGADVGKMTNYCNAAWKRNVVDNWLRRTQGVSPDSVRSWIGFSADEMPRVVRMMRGQEYQEGRIWLPLVDRGMKRADSIRLVEEMGWPTPPRSACWCCPNQTDAEWLDLSPDEFAMACELEKEMQRKDPDFWLHDSCVPLAEVQFKRPDDASMAMRCDAGDGAACFT